MVSAALSKGFKALTGQKGEPIVPGTDGAPMSPSNAPSSPNDLQLESMSIIDSDIQAKTMVEGTVLITPGIPNGDPEHDKYLDSHTYQERDDSCKEQVSEPS
jgi:hypothetical protein